MDSLGLVIGFVMHHDSISELSQQIHAQTVSPVDIVEACLTRIAALTVLSVAHHDERAAKNGSRHPLA